MKGNMFFMLFWWYLKWEIVSEDWNRRILFYGFYDIERYKVCLLWLFWIDFLYGLSKGVVVSDGDNYWKLCVDVERENLNLFVYRVIESRFWIFFFFGKINYFFVKNFGYVYE